jgi:hypothetical protein
MEARDFLERSGKLLFYNPILLLPAVFYVLFSAAFMKLAFGAYFLTDAYLQMLRESMGWTYILFLWIVDVPSSIVGSIVRGVTFGMAKESYEGGRATLVTGTRTLGGSWMGLALIGLLLNVLIASFFLILFLLLWFLSGGMRVLGSLYFSFLLLLALVVGLVKVYRKIGPHNAASLFFFAVPSLVFENLGVREAIRRGAGISERIWESMKASSSKKELPAFLWNPMLALFVVMLIQSPFKGRAAERIWGNAVSWVCVVTRPLFFAYTTMIFAVFFLFIWEKFTKEEKRLVK